MSRTGRCADCRHFEDDADAFERAFPGILALGSGRGDARGDQGLCRVHGGMVTPDGTCGSHGSTISILDMDNRTRQDDGRDGGHCSRDGGPGGSGAGPILRSGSEP